MKELADFLTVIAVLLPSMTLLAGFKKFFAKK